MKDKELKDDVEAAMAVLRGIKLEDASDVSAVIEKVASEFFTQQEIPLATCIQLTQIAAKIGATVGGSFHFATRDVHLRKSSSVILFDRDGTLEAFFDQAWCHDHFLHPDYTKNYTSCTSEEWLTWVSSGRAGLLGFAPLISTCHSVYGRKNIETELLLRGASSGPFYAYVTSHFQIEDWDFEKTHWTHWSAVAKEDPGIWGRIVDHILDQPDATWAKAKSARVLQVATTGNTRPISAPLLPAWILKLQELPCLRDTRGFYRKPAELLRRTPETESLMDVEPFIHGLLDSEATRPLLNLLGVRDIPTGPDRLLDCLRALAKAENPPIHEVEKWYRRLDQMIDTCSTTDLANIKAAFLGEKIILTEGTAWMNASGVFLSSDEEDMPGMAIIAEQRYGQGRLIRPQSMHAAAARQALLEVASPVGSFFLSVERLGLVDGVEALPAANPGEPALAAQFDDRHGHTPLPAAPAAGGTMGPARGEAEGRTPAGAECWKK